MRQEYSSLVIAAFGNRPTAAQAKGCEGGLPPMGQINDHSGAKTVTRG